MKRILVPCDFSEPSVEAFKFAVEVAARSGGTIHLLNVVELPVLYDSAAVLSFEQAFMDDRKKEVEKNFTKMKSKWAKDMPVIVKTHIQYGSAVSVIRRMIQETKADLVVLGTHGAKGMKEFTIGSNTEKIVRSSSVPVISIKKAGKTVRNIVFPTTPDVDLEEITMHVKRLQSFFDATLHVLYVNTPARFKTDGKTKKMMNDFAKRFMLKNHTLNIFNDISEESGIANFAKEVNADIIAMRTHGRRGISHLTTGSIAEDVVNHIDCAIWTYKIA
ncbi:MAG: universal stress protein [Cytophagales bacterium]|nr:universal stress protein [Cytophagales bacterium]